MQTQQAQLQELLTSIEAVLTNNLASGTAHQLLEFAEHLLTLAPLDELSSWPQEKLTGILLSSWSLGQKFTKGAAKVKVFNPNLDRDGWHSARTVIHLISVDRLLMIDTVLTLLKDRNLNVHTLLNGVYTVERNAEGQLEELLATKESNANAEAWINLEIDQLATPEELEQLQADLQVLLSEVDLAAEDYSAMREQLLATSQALQKAALANPSLENTLINCTEASEFLALIADHHFVLLGYDQHQLVEQAGNLELTKVANSELGLLKLDSSSSLSNLPEDIITFTKAPTTSGAMRTAYPDQILVKSFDAQGKVQGVIRFLGLYSPSFYNRIPRYLPVLRKKVASLMSNLGVEAVSHNGRQLLQVVDTYPQDDLLHLSTAELTETILNIFKLRNRRKTRAFIRQNQLSQLYSVLVYLPKVSFTAKVQQKIEQILSQALDAKLVKVNVYFSTTTTLARIQLVLLFNKLPAKEFSVQAIEQQIIEATSSWDDLLHGALQQELGEAAANRLVGVYQQGFSAAYYENFTPQQAAKDIQNLESLTSTTKIAVNLYQPLSAAGQLGLKVFSLDQELNLSDLLPVLSNLGLKVLRQHPYKAQKGKNTVWLYDFSLAIKQDNFELGAVKASFQEALVQIWQGQAENDTFNQLIIAAGLNWRKVEMLRAYGKYLQQLPTKFSLNDFAKCLVMNPQASTLIAQLFAARFNPQTVNAAQEAACVAKLEEIINAVDSLKTESILRSYLELIRATLRTNFYQLNAVGQPKDALSFKINPSAISNMPQPHPMFEIFVCSPRVEGVHLRYGTTARGGLRWSDRLDDYRTEVLGLVKAQQVKNAVIVPVGAKGGFVCKQMPESPSRDEFIEEGQACYKVFVSALLDLTDNLVGKDFVTPENLVRHDGDDAYLVVAADKGTATFSDLANAISAEYDFWLGDAFASGGSDGYDHKKMGITASGAWVNMQRHFREIGLNTQEQTFSVVGIGDMSGDVFGNGMLQSDKILLTAAFNHLHIFIDPNPADSVASFNERKRLFALPRSSWTDYKSSLISVGGGIFERSAKSITITPEMQDRFGISATKLTPDALISALLKAPVDLLWNGGIGTYVKGSQESHASVGDKANDLVRVDGKDLRCKVIGEGGNLGFTQAARIEAALKGISVNADFIDNAGGVNCSDHEVNIKILLQEVVNAGDLTEKQRNKLLVEMTDEVARLVLRDNYTQSQALSLAAIDSQVNLTTYASLIDHLEQHAGLSRKLEFLPTQIEIEARGKQGLGLTRPELAVLLAYTKAEVKNLILATDLPDDPWLAKAMKLGFPQVLVENYAKALNNHRLKRELVATMLTNQLVDRLGITFMYRLKNRAGYKVEEIIRGYAASRDICNFIPRWEALEQLDYQVAPSLQLDLMQQLGAMLERTCTWLIDNQFVGKNAEQTITNLKPSVAALAAEPEQLPEPALAKFKQLSAVLVQAGINQNTAVSIASANFLDAALIKE